MSFSKAAEERFVTPAAISHQIHGLEQDLGVRLFHQLNRSVALTAPTRVLLPGFLEGSVGIEAAVGRRRRLTTTAL